MNFFKFFKKKIIDEKIFITEEEFKILSSSIAEKEHHKYCEYECCGSHNDFNYLDKRCPNCGMTEEIQEKHNDQVWALIDHAEAELLEKYTIMWKHEDPEDCCHSDHFEKIGKEFDSGIEGVYHLPYFCPNCNYFVNEVNHFEGTELA